MGSVNSTTRSASLEQLQASFIPGSQGALFCLRSEPLSVMSRGLNGLAPVSAEAQRGAEQRHTRIVEGVRHVVLFLPPFGEELNLCRRFFSLVRSQLSVAGAVSLLPDLYGTGDSAGLLEEARWDLWIDDLVCVVRHFLEADSENSQANHKLSLVAIRAGCLLAPDLISALTQQALITRIHNLVFVQPESSGKDVINRLFRARILAQRLAGNRSESINDLWALVERGEDVHAGGQTISSRLCLSMREQTLDNAIVGTCGQTRSWFNLRSLQAETDQRADDGNGQTLPPSAWHEQEIICSAFWQAYDVEPDLGLVEAVARAATQSL